MPPGLDYNPSARRERLPVIGLALLGFAISFYLALYQWGAIPGPWDPVFGSTSSGRVLHSFISRTLPVPDATLGVLGYLTEVVLCAIGGHERWREHPWLVLLYGLLVLGMGLVGIGLLLSQALLVRSWCTLCVFSATISITILLVASREVLATIRYVDLEHSSGCSLWTALRGSSPHRCSSAP